MVLQRGQANRDLGLGGRGGGRSPSPSPDRPIRPPAGADGKWTVKLDPLPAGGPHTMTVQGKNALTFDDVLVGEVWVCSGQSNMQWRRRRGQRRRPRDADGQLSPASA